MTDSLRVLYGDCASLLHDLEHYISDQQLRAQGTSVLYVLDFAEIHPYLFGQHEPREMHLFADDPPELPLIVEDQARSELIFGEGSRPVLLEPYLIELADAVQRIQDGDFETAASDAALGLDALAHLRRHRDYGFVRKLAGDIASGSREPSQADLDRALRFFEAHAPELLSLMALPESEPRARLRTLLSGRRFMALDEILPDPIDPSPHILENWYEGLRAKRPEQPPSPSYRDARAVALIHGANRLLAGQGKCLRLVTRSRLMHELASELGGGAWEELGGQPLRHPRCFGAFSFTSGDAKRALHEAEFHAKTLRAFVESYASLEAGPVDGPGEKEHTQLDQSVRSIQDRWRLSVSLSWAPADPSSPRSSKPPRENGESARVRQLLGLLWDETALRTRIATRVAELAGLMQQELQLLGLQAQGQSLRQRSLIEEGVSFQDDTDESGKVRSVLRSHLYFMPYTLEFYSEEVSRLAGSIAAKGYVDWPRLMDGFRAMGESFNFERLLAIAYCFAVMDRWRVAEQYADLALDVGGDRDVPRHEGLFFKAVCAARHAASVERFATALQLLEDASKEKQAARGDEAHLDPRYLKERAFVILKWNDLAASGLPKWQSPALPPVASAEKISQQALSLIRDDDMLRAQIHNNLCFFYLARGEQRAMHRAAKHLERLEEAVARIQETAEDLPPFLIDTVAWARWKLASPEERSVVAADSTRLLERALRILRPEDPNRRAVEGHLHAVRTSLAPSGAGSHTSPREDAPIGS